VCTLLDCRLANGKIAATHFNDWSVGGYAQSCKPCTRISIKASPCDLAKHVRGFGVITGVRPMGHMVANLAAVQHKPDSNSVDQLH
jgi:hypothetical protein